MGVGIIDVKKAGRDIGKIIASVPKAKDLGVVERGFGAILDNYDTLINTVTNKYEEDFKNNYSGAKNKIKRFFSSKRRGNLKDFKKGLELDTKSVEDFVKLLGVKALDVSKKIKMEEEIKNNGGDETKWSIYALMVGKLEETMEHCEGYLGRLKKLCKEVGVAQKKTFAVDKVTALKGRSKNEKTEGRAGISNERSSYNDAYFGFQDAVDVCRNKISMAKLKLDNLKKTYNIDDISYPTASNKTGSCKKYFNDTLRNIEKIAEEAEGKYKKLEKTLEDVESAASKEKAKDGNDAVPILDESTEKLKKNLITTFTNYLNKREGTAKKKEEGTISYYSNCVDIVAKPLNERVGFIESLKNYYVFDNNMGIDVSSVKKGKYTKNSKYAEYTSDGPAPDCLTVVKKGKMDKQYDHKKGDSIFTSKGPYYVIIDEKGGIVTKANKGKTVNASSDESEAIEEVVSVLKQSIAVGKWVSL